MRIALIGNPNCGKTTLFNALTGLQQKIGNWPGVTVEQKSGSFTIGTQSVEVIDLPGIYSLTRFQDSAQDQVIAQDFLSNQSCDILINILDASHLERHLYLTTQLIDMGLPMIVVLNMMDAAKALQLTLDEKQLSERLGCPVIAIQANKNINVDTLKQLIVSGEVSAPTCSAFLPHDLSNFLNQYTDATMQLDLIRALEGDVFSQINCGDIFQQCQTTVSDHYQEESDIVIADFRYDAIHRLCQQVIQSASHTRKTLSERIDAWVLNKWLGIPIFLTVLYGMFFFAIHIGGIFQDCFDIISEAVFVDGFTRLGQSLQLPDWGVALLGSGVGKGINTTVTFIPVIAAMFFYLALLEQSGYMARAAFVMDRLMRAMGLPGKAFVPLIVGFGCNVPAIMATRTLESHQDRILTTLMAPFMSCGARLAIFAVFTAAFFPSGGQNIIFFLYLLGIFMAVLTGLLLRKTILSGEPSPFILELPPYHAPVWRSIVLSVRHRLTSFVWRAGRYIVPVCVLLGCLNAITIDGRLSLAESDTQSILSWLGQYLTPLFAPMGLSPDNWPATVGLLTGMLAKEVVVGTLNTLYSQLGHLQMAATTSFDLWQAVQEGLISIWLNICDLPYHLGNPILSTMPDQDVTPGVYGMMYHYFGGQAGALAYLIFVLLYIPCVSTMAVIARELNRAWAIFALIWSLVTAYLTAVLFYQLVTASLHVWYLLIVIGAALLVLGSVIFSMRAYRVRWQQGA